MPPMSECQRMMICNYCFKPFYANILHGQPTIKARLKNKQLNNFRGLRKIQVPP